VHSSRLLATLQPCSQMATNIEPDETATADVDFGWPMGHLSGLIKQLHDIKDERELSVFILDHVFAEITNHEHERVALMNLLWLAYEFPADSEMRVYHTLCLPRHQLRQIVTYAAHSRKGWAIDGRPTSLLLKSSYLELWKQRGLSAFREQFGANPAGHQKQLAVVPFEEGALSFGILENTPPNVLRMTDQRESEILDAYNSPLGWNPVAGRPDNYLHVIMYLFESSSNEFTAMRAVKKIQLWAVDHDGACQDKILVILCWMSLGLAKDSSMSHLLSSPWMTKSDDSSALLLHRYVELGIRGYAKGGEPTRLLIIHPLIQEAIPMGRVECNKKKFAKLDVPVVTIFDALFEGMQFQTKDHLVEHRTKKAKQGPRRMDDWTLSYEMSFQF
jgi:hypothetical protein